MTTDDVEELDPVAAIWARSPSYAAIDPEALDRWRDHAAAGDGHDMAHANKNTLFRLIGTIDKLAADLRAKEEIIAGMRADMQRIENAMSGHHARRIARASLRENGGQVAVSENRLFDLLEGVAKALEANGQRDRAQALRAGFARGTNGADLPFLIEQLTASEITALKEAGSCK